jgi:hypothetical protein
VGSAELLAPLASLALTLGRLLDHMGKDVANHRSTPQQLHAMANDVLPCCCLVASKLLHLAAQQLEVLRSRVLPALQLATAAQQLAGACAELADAIAIVLAPGAEGSWATSFRRMALGLVLLWDQVVVLSRAQPSWQQAAAEKGGTQRADAAEDPAPGDLSSSSSSNSSSSSLHAGRRMHTAHVSAWRRHTPQGPVDLLTGMAHCIQHACRPRLQLAGCSHRHCINLSGPTGSVEGLVAGRKGVTCGGCRVVRYCSSACQQADWPRHRHVCRRLAAGPAQDSRP